MGKLSVSRNHAGARRATILIRADVNPCDGHSAESCRVRRAATDVVPVLVPVRRRIGAHSVMTGQRRGHGQVLIPSGFIALRRSRS